MKFENLKIVETIQESKLHHNTKRAVLKRLRRIYESPEESKKCSFLDGDCLLVAFAWIDTEDGHDYWYEIDGLLAEVRENG